MKTTKPLQTIEAVRVKAPPCKHCGAVDFVPLDEQAKAQLQQLIEWVIAQDDEHKRVQKPGHGICCTCQVCGLDYDDCPEVKYEYRNDLRAEQRKRLTSIMKG